MLARLDCGKQNSASSKSHPPCVSLGRLLKRNKAERSPRQKEAPDGISEVKDCVNSSGLVIIEG